MRASCAPPPPCKWRPTLYCSQNSVGGGAQVPKRVCHTRILGLAEHAYLQMNWFPAELGRGIG